MQDLQSKIQAKGEEILAKTEQQSKGSIFSKDFWYGRIMEWSMQNENFKTKMFRFVDVLPALTDNDDVAKHLKEYFTENGEEMPSIFNVGLGLGSLAPGLMAGTIRKNVTQMAKMFITGESPQEALPVLQKARKNKMTFTVDILGEATLGEDEAKDYQSRYMELISWLSKDAQKWDEIPLIDRDNNGPIPRINVSVKLTALYSQINDKAWEHTKEILKERLRPILRSAIEKNVFLNLDMEQYSVKHLTLEVFKELLIEPEFKNYPHLGCVIQAYLRDSLHDIRDLSAFARTRGTPFTVRLVKGAYWDYETIEAAQRGWETPVYTIKAESDANYEACARELLEGYPHIRVAFASHNVRTIAAAMIYAEQLNIPKNAFEIQMLFGMADQIKKALVDMDYRVREYAPVGELIPGMAYLVRRLLENSSNESWLRAKFADGASMAHLLRDPAKGLTQSSGERVKSKNFENEPLLDFALEENRKKTLASIEKFKKEKMGKIYSSLINGVEIKSNQTLAIVNPSQKSQKLGEIGLASRTDAENAIQSAHKALKKWSKTTPNERAQLLHKLADAFQKNKFDLIADQVLEVGKPWAEADADVAEAIDFCRYYADHLLTLSKPQKVGNVPAENSRYHYQPRGVTLVIAPWNFPLAIVTGMVGAAVVTGNTVIIKPAEQSTIVASALPRLMKEAGFPTDVFHFLPGIGEDIGEYLVDHPLTATIAFTGSKAVGLRILQRASIVHPGQKHVKKCIIEMGGKNAVIIDSDADLDEAVDGVLYSAFGFAGQKCSACSRTIVLEEVYDRFKSRLVDATKALTVAAAEDPRAYLGPVIDEASHSRILAMIEAGKADAAVAFQAPAPNEGHFVGPTIFDNVPAHSRLAQEEIFGPVLALIKARDLDHALEIANSTEYALTGGFFSRSPAHIARVKNEFECGNLYINRGITGAMVDRHPFGGFKLSGVGSKTGGPDYLLQYVEPRVVTENTMRRGFAPAEN